MNKILKFAFLNMAIFSLALSVQVVAKNKDDKNEQTATQSGKANQDPLATKYCWCGIYYQGKLTKDNCKNNCILCRSKGCLYCGLCLERQYWGDSPLPSLDGLSDDLKKMVEDNAASAGIYKPQISGIGSVSKKVFG